MNPEQLQERDALTAAVNDLIEEVRALNAKLANYPPRDEVRRDGRRRGWRFLGFAIAIILAAQLMTMTTISYCFLDASGEGGRHGACDVLPGYSEAMQQNEIRLARFEMLLTTIEKNKAEIARLNAEVEQIKKEG